jgi:GTPase SAR1 family protein
MADTLIPSSSLAAIDPRALRIVLFGMPQAGKSSLLGALAQAAQTQENAFSLHLNDLSHGLAALQSRLYEGAPRETLEEVVPYLVAFEPVEPQLSPGKIEVVFVDCDGRVANDLLMRRQLMEEQNGQGNLAGAILAADSLILVIDASAPPTRVHADFAQFEQFLRHLEQNRGRRSAIGGLPVFLVLTKCDLLAQSNDTPAAWIDRIEERKRQVADQFRDFLNRQNKAGSFSFGCIQFHIWATAVKRPALIGSPSQPREPFGVAELFRQSLDSARDFRQRRKRSGHRLFWTVAITSACMVMTVNLTAALLLHRQESNSNSSPGRSRIQELENSEDFDKLLRIYLADLQNDDDLDRIDNVLKENLPKSLKKEGNRTETALLRSRLIKELQAWRLAVASAEEWFRNRISRAEMLRTFAEGKPADERAWENWFGQVRAVLDLAFPHSGRELIPGSSTLTFDEVLGLDRVIQASKDWAVVQAKLERLQELTGALGLAGKFAPGERPPLDIPEKCTLAVVKSQYQQVTRQYPHLLNGFDPSEIPDAIRSDVLRTAETSYDRLLETGRGVVLAHLRQNSTNARETPELWRSLVPWLREPVELQEWRALAHLLAQLKNPKPKDTLLELADFIGNESFNLDIQRLSLQIPLNQKWKPMGAITVFYGPANATAKPAIILKIRDEVGKADLQRGIIAYTFACADGTVIRFRPGASFFAHVRVKKDNDSDDWMLTWARSRSEMFPFECLVRPPRLHRADQVNTEGELVETINLIVIPETGLPEVPELIPVVKLNE